MHNCQLSIDQSSWKDEMKMVPLMEAPVFSIWNSRYNCDQIGLFEVLNNRMLGFWVVLFGACLWQILLCLVTSLISRFVFSSSSSLTVMLAFRELWHAVHSWRSQTCTWGPAGVKCVCVFCLVAKVIGIKTKMACFPNLCKHLGKVWWKNRNSSQFLQGSQVQHLYPFSHKHVIQCSDTTLWTSSE